MTKCFVIFRKRGSFFWWFFLAALVFLTGFCPCLLFAQKLYVFFEGDYYDEARKEEVRHANDCIQNTILTNIPREYVVCYNDIDPDENSENKWIGPNIGKSENAHDDILEAIDRCPAGNDDTIFFYWTGRSGQDDRGDYLLMPEGCGRPKMYRSEILEALRKKNPRLVVFITDSCSAYHIIPAVSPPRIDEVPPETDKRLLSEAVPPLFVNLFFRHDGVLDMHSSCPSQEEYADLDVPYFNGSGTVFARAVAEILEKKRLESYSWQTFISQVSSTSFSRQFGLETRVWQYPQKLPSSFISDNTISGAEEWKIIQLGPNGQIRETYRPYRRRGSGADGQRPRGEVPTIRDTP